MNEELKKSMQSLFDKAVSLTYQQGRKSRNELSGSCVYRLKTDTGVLKCAIGHVLSDEQIKKYDISLASEVQRFPMDLIVELIPGAYTYVDMIEARGFMNRLQAAHDNASTVPALFPETFLKGANDVAFAYGLTPYSPTV